MSLSLNNSTIVPLLSGEIFLGKEYDNILDFAEIDIAIKCDVGYTLTYIYSQDKLSIDYSTNQTVSAQVNTQFYRIPVNDRYFKLKIEATDGDMSVLNVQTIYKSVPTFNNSGAGPTSNVAITAPLNGDGSVFVGGSLTLGGSVDANITNGSLDVNVINALLDVSDADTHTKLDSVITDLDKFKFNGDNLLTQVENTVVVSGSVDINNYPATFPISGSVSVSNFPATQAVSNGSLASMSFNTNRLNVLDSDANTTLTNIYNIVNSRGTSQLFNSIISAGGYTNIVNLSSKNIKNLTFYGTQNSNGNILTVCFSNDGNTIYDSQYSYSFVGSGDFGFSIQCCPNYVIVKSKDLCALTMYVDYC